MERAPTSERPAIEESRWAALLDLVEGDRGLLKSLVGQFASEAGRHLSALRSALRDGDASTLERVASELSASAEKLGAAELGELAGSLGTLAAHRHLGAVPETLDRIASAIEHARDELVERVRKLPA